MLLSAIEDAKLAARGRLREDKYEQLMAWTFSQEAEQWALAVSVDPESFKERIVELTENP